MENAQADRRKLSLRKKLAFACVPVVLLLLLTEAGLWIAGYESPVADPYESFVLRHPLFIKGNGVLTTSPARRRFFHWQSFGRAKPEGARRIFVFGGSTTYGYSLPDPWNDSYVLQLGRLLEQDFPGTRFEMVNCGGLSYASYRLVDLVEECINYSPDLVVIMSGHNEFIEARHYDDLIREHSASSRLWYSLRTVRLMQYLSNRVSKPKSNLGENPFITEQYIVRDEKEFEYTHEHYRRNLNRMLAACRQANVPVILCTCASNLEHRPFHSEPPAGMLIPEFRSVLMQAQQLMEAGEYEKCLQLAEENLQRDEKCAVFHFIRGQCCIKLGRMEDAKVSLVRARDTDAFPKRTLTSFNASVREIAAEHDVVLFDAESAFERASEHEIPGKNLFVDDCHPTPDGHRIFAEGLHPLAAELLKKGR